MNTRFQYRSPAVPLLEKLKDATRVAWGVFLFCSVSIVGLSILAWLVLWVLDPMHSAFAAAKWVARFDRIPLGVTSGMAIFFAAVSWDSAEARLGNLNRSVHRRLTVIENRLGIKYEREAS